MKTLLNRTALLAAAASLTLAGAALAQSDMNGGTTPPPAGGSSMGSSNMDASGSMPKMSQDDMKQMTQDYLRGQESQNLLEQKLGKLAQKSDDPQIKSFGETILKNHEQAQQQLKDVAKEASVSLTGELSQMDSAKYSELSKLNGKMFDMKYAFAEVGGHISDILVDKCVVQTAQDQAVKSYAQKDMMTQQKHLQMISQVASSYVGGSSVQSLMSPSDSGMSSGGMDSSAQPAAGGNMGGGNMNTGR